MRLEKIMYDDIFTYLLFAQVYLFCQSKCLFQIKQNPYIKLLAKYTG